MFKILSLEALVWFLSYILLTTLKILLSEGIGITISRAMGKYKRQVNCLVWSLNFWHGAGI